jgi:aminoglycoside phosphotransferase (APT) family kinase protein
MTRSGDEFERVVRRVHPHGTLISARSLKGGVSAAVTALEVGLPDGHRTQLVVRQHGDADLRRNPDIARDEFTLLRALHSAGLPVPVAHDVDETREILAKPYLVIEYVDGHTEFDPARSDSVVDALATCLRDIHRSDLSTLDLSFLPEQELVCARRLRTRPETVDDSLDEGRIRQVLEPVWPPRRRNRSVLLHGDFWPGNVLWRDGRLVAVIDWEDAAIGDPLADLASSRLEILWAFGPAAMRDFTARYAALMPGVDLANLAYWDLCAALRPASQLSDWGLAAEVEQSMRRSHREFVGQALTRLARAK